MRHFYGLVAALGLLSGLGCCLHNTCDCCSDPCAGCCHGGVVGHVSPVPAGSAPAAAPAPAPMPRPEEIKKAPMPGM